MEAPDQHPSISRIEAAVARIERATATRAYSTDSLARRHAALRQRMEEAVAVLDELIAREGKN